jgi:hypothetical protein
MIPTRTSIGRVQMGQGRLGATRKV